MEVYKMKFYQIIYKFDDLEVYQETITAEDPHQARGIFHRLKVRRHGEKVANTIKIIDVKRLR